VAATSDGSVGTWPAAAIDSPFLGDLFLGPVEELQYVPDDRGVMFLQGNALQALDLETREQYTFCQVEDRYCHELCVMPVDLLTGETDASGQDWLVHRRGGSGEILAEASISPAGGIGDLQFDATSEVITLHKPLENGPALRMFSLVPLNEVKPWRLRNVPKFSTYSPSTDCLIVVSQNSLVAHDILKRDVVWRKDVPGDVVAIAMSLDGRFVASATEDRIIRIWDARDGSLVAEMIGHHGQITSVVFANDGRTLFSGDHRVKEPSEVRCWRVATGHFLGVVHSAENASIDQLLISRSNDRLLIRYGRQRLKIVPLKPTAVR
jgi:hypothetical protein